MVVRLGMVVGLAEVSREAVGLAVNGSATVVCLLKPGGGPPNQSLEPTLLSRILLKLFLPLQHCKSSLVTLSQPQGGSAPPLGTPKIVSKLTIQRGRPEKQLCVRMGRVIIHNNWYGKSLRDLPEMRVWPQQILFPCEQSFFHIAPTHHKV